MITIAEIRRLVPIDKHELDRELATQAEVMFRISEAKTKAASTMHDAKDNLATVEARLLIGIRRGETKLTAAEASSSIQQHDKRLVAYDRYQEARHDHEQWEDIFEIWKQRGFALRAMADLYLGKYYATDSHGGRSRITTSGSLHSGGRSRSST